MRPMSVFGLGFVRDVLWGSGEGMDGGRGIDGVQRHSGLVSKPEGCYRM